MEPVYFFKTIQNDVKRVVLETLESSLKDKQYHPVDASKWTSSISSLSLDKLRHLQDSSVGFKFIVHVSIVQKKNGGIHTCSACHWNSDTDGQVVVRYESSSLVAIATVYALSLQ
ncbi:hypothetical protein THRCLA_21830 [Thraustotheca clavata]|uniref:Dynein light chain n=1 Tax=Thraustotheca clavata TaxID=74557 RepID=A0A1V9ZNB2_9STRA|nr:hypothetical protein THRCLA_21830 [Thraustotheca clavata]